MDVNNGCGSGHMEPLDVKLNKTASSSSSSEESDEEIAVPKFSSKGKFMHYEDRARSRREDTVDDVWREDDASSDQKCTRNRSICGIATTLLVFIIVTTSAIIYFGERIVQSDSQQEEYANEMLLKNSIKENSVEDMNKTKPEHTHHTHPHKKHTHPKKEHSCRNCPDDDKDVSARPFKNNGQAGEEDGTDNKTDTPWGSNS